MDLSGNGRFFHWLTLMMMWFLLDVTELWRIVFTRHITYKHIVNVNVSKMAFAQKKQVRLNREGGIYGKSSRHSHREFPAITRLRFRLAPRSHKGFGFSCSIETAAAERLQKPESIHQQ